MLKDEFSDLALLAARASPVFSFAEVLMGGRCGQGGTRGAMGEGSNSSLAGGSGITEIGAWG